MAQAILRNEDFKSTSLVQNIQGIVYRGDGFPIGRVLAANLGALYLDNLSGQLWIATAVSSTATTAWKPYFGTINNNVRIDSDVQEGDLIGIYGAGTWATSALLSGSRSDFGGAGTQNAALVNAGTNSVIFLTITEKFNGSVWTIVGASVNALQNPGMCGAQNAVVKTAGTKGSAFFSATEIFDGSTWSTSAIISHSRAYGQMFGSLFASLFNGGQSFGGDVMAASYAFNGSTWSIVANSNTSRLTALGVGAYSAGMIAGGSSGVTRFATSEFFNGSAWMFSGNFGITRDVPFGSGTQNAAFAAGGNTSATQSTRTCELFNGTTWSATGNLNGTKGDGAAAGSQSAGLIAGGIFTSTRLRITELHTQSIYRKLKYPYIQNSLNMGMAYSVSSTSLTASLITGDVGSFNIPSTMSFGVSRQNNPQNNIFLASLTPTVSSITLVVTGQARLNLSTTLTLGFWTGACLLDSSGNSYPIVGGTDIAPVVRWENASNSASPGGLTVTPVYGHKFTSLSTSNILLTNNSLVMTLTGNTNIDANTFARWIKLGDAIQIPYASASGTNGSSLNYGTYAIAAISGFQISVTKLNSASASETANVGNIKILQHAAISANCTEPVTIELGYNGKMHLPYYAFMDDATNGRM